MPETVAPRPNLRVPYCLNCIKKLSTDVKGTRQVEVTVFCTRDNVGSKCNPCRKDSGNHNCDPVPAEFNRAVNILVHLQQQCRIYEPNAADMLRREDRVRDYATKLKDAIAAWNKQTASALKKDKDWVAHRRASYLENMRRYEQGLGAVGELTPMNQEVDSFIEQALRKQWISGDKWWYLRAVWFGSVE